MRKRLCKPLLSVQQVAVPHTVQYLPVHSLCGKMCMSKVLTPCLRLGRWTAESVSLFLVVCVSEFEILNKT